MIECAHDAWLYLNFGLWRPWQSTWNVHVADSFKLRQRAEFHVGSGLLAPRIMNIKPSNIQTSELKSIRREAIGEPLFFWSVGPNFGVFPVSTRSSFPGHSRRNRYSWSSFQSPSVVLALSISQTTYRPWCQFHDLLVRLNTSHRDTW